MAVNKVVTGAGTTLFDLTGDTVTSAAHIMSGFIGHLADGTQVTGTGSGGGGATNFVMGEFTGTVTGAAMDITLPYTGSGYPLYVVVSPSEGIQNKSGTFYTTVQRYAIRSFTVYKAYFQMDPRYAGSYDGDYGLVRYSYKSSSSYATSFSSGSQTVYIYKNENASNTNNKVLRIKSATTLSVFIASTSYGFMANIPYTYIVAYSS